MFTSRAEHRLLLRQDNCDLRLSEVGHAIGLLSEQNYHEFSAKRDAIAAELTRLSVTRLGTETLAQKLRRPEVTYADLPLARTDLAPEVVQQVEIAVKYEGYILRQEIEVSKLKALEEKVIPTWMNYEEIHGLRKEARQKLGIIRPATIGQATRISGVSPADVSVLLVWLKRPQQNALK
jgi:tRNA uridine 5-carboxymethylaminomethyl modification enzyme